jgi:subtilisin family serine protease
MRSICCLAAAALVSTLLVAPPAFADDGRYIVKFRAGRGPAARQAVQAGGGRVVVELGPQNALGVELPEQAIAALRANPNVEYVENDPRRYPMAQTTPWGIKMVQADQVGDGSASNRLVCIIDSGYSLNHEDLDSDAGITGTNDSGTGNWWVDNCGHGTHVAGTVSALDNDRGVVGVMSSGGARLHIVKVFGDNCAWTYSSNLVSALNQCRTAGANVVSMSLGCSGNRCRSTTEETAFNNAYNAGVLSIAAAGNAGNTQTSYPAGYASVVSVAAIDSAKVVASFSQQNSTVELAAPGVAVRSTVPMGTGADESVSVGGVGYEAVAMEGSPTASGTGPLVDCGLGTSACPGGGGQVCLIQRGTNSFAEKVQACQSGGGVGAIIYNNADPLFAGTLGGTVTTIPSVGISGVDGAFLESNALGSSATVTTGPGNYAFFDGTSMATPHVSAVAALVWSYNTGWTNAQIRTALQSTAEDLGAAGRDNAYGYGLVRAKAALCSLNPSLTLCGGGGGDPNDPPTASFTFTCTDLSCSFNGSGSSDGDGTIASYAWNFGDGTTGGGATVNHSYAAGGTYTVTLTVTDDDGATGSQSQSVTVTSPPSSGITLSVTGYKVKGLQKADLTWGGATTASVDIFRNGTRITTTANDGSHTDNIDARGGGTYTYKVCEAGTTTCSGEVTIVF